jgi:cytochrome oxidase Cu insertion factor (SCO1/SenC/PrrC family)
MSTRLRTLTLAALLASMPTLISAHDNDKHTGTTPADDTAVRDAVSSLANTQTRVMTREEEIEARNYFTDLPLIDQHGKARRFYSDVLRGRTVLIDFIYTNCENSCPMTTAMLNTVRGTLGERFGNEVIFISMSVDPKRDTPEEMRKFAEKLKANVPGWFFLTGTPENIERIVSKLGQYTADPTQHSMLMLAGNVPAKHWTKITPMMTVPQLVLKLQTLSANL